MLFAQSVPPASTIPGWLFPLMGVMIVAMLGIIPALLIGLRAAYIHRQFQHTERMKAIEVGYPLEDTEASKTNAKHMHNSFWIAFWLGFGVPAVVFWAASSAEQVNSGNIGLGIVVWGGATVASIAGVVGAVVLMIYSRIKQCNDSSIIPAKPIKPSL